MFWMEFGGNSAASINHAIIQGNMPNHIIPAGNQKTVKLIRPR